MSWCFGGVDRSLAHRFQPDDPCSEIFYRLLLFDNPVALSFGGLHKVQNSLFVVEFFWSSLDIVLQKAGETKILNFLGNVTNLRTVRCST